MLKPHTLSHVEAAASMLSGCVAWAAIKTARIEAGDHCLVVGASGAIGSLMVQFLKSKGAHVTGVCSGANAGLVNALGADDTIDYKQTDFGAQGWSTYDKVFDLVGGREVETAACRTLKRKGRFVTLVNASCPGSSFSWALGTLSGEAWPRGSAALGIILSHPYHGITPMQPC